MLFGRFEKERDSQRSKTSHRTADKIPKLISQAFLESEEHSNLY